MNKRARLSDTATLPIYTPTQPKTSNNPFTYDLISKPATFPSTFSSRGRKSNRHTTEITLSVPSDEEECPLTLDPIATSKLPCLDTPFLLDRPLHSKLTLPCGHSFSAMTLIYSFCKNSMTCPCCRAGEDIQADTIYLPAHFRSLLKAKIQDTLETERSQDEAREYQEVLDSFSMFGVTIPYESLGANGNLSLVANFYDMPTGNRPSSSIRPIFSFSNLVEPSRENGRMVLVPRGPLRALTHVAHMGINSIQLSMVLSMQGMGDVLIDSSPITRLPDVLNHVHDQTAPIRLTIPGASSSSVTQNSQFQVLVQLQVNGDNNPSTSFAVLFSRSGLFSVLDTIMWSPGTENLEILSSNTSLVTML